MRLIDVVLDNRLAIKSERWDIEKGYLTLEPEHYNLTPSRHAVYPFVEQDRLESVQFNLIYEGLIKSESANVVEQKLKQHLPNLLIDNEFDDEGLTNRIFITINQINEKDWLFLNKLLNVLGWFVSVYKNNDTWIKYTNQNIINKLPVELQCEAKYDIEDIGSPNIPDVMYHATPTTYVNKIQKIGLVPKTKNSALAYDDRIYVAVSLNNLIQRLLPHMSEESGIKDWTIFEVNPSREILPIIRWFRDPNYPYGYYTKTNIPSNRLTIYTRIQL